MILKTDNEQARELIANWRSLLPSNQAIAARSRREPELRAQLQAQIERVDALDVDSSTHKQVAEVIGYQWTRCTNCGAIGDLVEIGFEHDDALGAFLCRSCCESALKLFKTA